MSSIQHSLRIPAQLDREISREIEFRGERDWSKGAISLMEGVRGELGIDEDVQHSCAEVGEAFGLDIRSAKDAQPSIPQDDPVHLRAAAQDRRIMVTYNRDDFLAATRDASASSAPHAGLLILTHRLPREPTRIVHALARWVDQRQATGAWPMQHYEVGFLSH
jgi:hypothetical protein